MNRFPQTLHVSTALLALPLLLVAAACSKDNSTPPPPPASSSFTLHYHRALGDYSGWTLQASAGTSATSVAQGTADAFGAVFPITLASGATSLAFTLANGSAVDAAGPLTVDVSGAVREAWVFSSYSRAIARTPPVLPAAGQVVLYYIRPDATYTGWGLHLWGDQVNNTTWGAPLPPTGTADADLGEGFAIPLQTGAAAGSCTAGKICLIVHKMDTKDPGPDMSWDPAAVGNIAFVTSGSATVTSAPVKAGQVQLAGAGAHLMARDTLAWSLDPAIAATVATWELRYDLSAGITAVAGVITGGTVINLTPNPAGLSAAIKAKSPFQANWPAFTVAGADLAALQTGLKGQLVAVARKADGTAVAATGVQIPYVLDDLYDYEGPLGVAFASASDHTPTFQLWAPTAQSLKVHVYDASKTEVAGSPFAMVAGSLGLWTYAGQASWYLGYYRYEESAYHPVTGKIETLTFTDPYSVSLSTNSAYSQLVDLADPQFMPAGWTTLAKPALANPTDIVLYEGHIRDFTYFDATTPAARRGKYLGFVTDSGAAQSNALKHLQEMASAGLTHVHIMPAFDIVSVNEDATQRIDLDSTFDKLCAKSTAVPAAMCTQYGTQVISSVLASLPGTSQDQQTIEGAMSAIDSFNWGYDPWHYGAPEGSYASNPEGAARVLEFRQMVQGLAAVGLRTVMDVVYNHTNASGIGTYSVLDKAVPGYYYRLDPASGAVLNGSGAGSDTATEHRMMERVLVDTVVRWARDYKVDGFRFDLMSLDLKQPILDAQTAVHALTVAHDGVDGSKIYLYGEGWSNAEVASNQHGTDASQLSMAGTGVGTFNDRMRDAVRGGGPFDSALNYRINQGFASGEFVDPNEQNPAPNQATTLVHADTIKLTLAGNLKDFLMIPANGTTAFQGGGVSYNGNGPAAYVSQPQESINYVASHDNETLWDILQYKHPTGTSTADRVRMHNLALDCTLLAQGVPFVLMGDEVLRSKSLDKNSYNAGDWFNRIDWTLQGNGWLSGLPQTADNGSNWATMTQYPLADNTTKAGPANIAAAYAHFKELLSIRKNTPLFRLVASADVKARVDFPDSGALQIPGLIAETISNGTCAGADLDPARDGVVLIINADKVAHAVTVPGVSGAFTLHAVQQASADPVVKTAAYDGAHFNVPARTTAVFELLRGGTRTSGATAGVPCNTH